MRLHQPRFGNVFYYADEGRLRAIVEAAIEDASTPRVNGTLHALIVPHGTHLECGPVAGYAYKLLYITPQRWERVAVLAPALRPDLDTDRLLVEPVEAYPTPIDLAPIDGAALADLQAQGVAIQGAPDDEPILETQLPFLQLTLGQLPCLPLRVPAGYRTPRALADQSLALGLIVAAANLPLGLEKYALHALQNRDTAGLRGERPVKPAGLLSRVQMLPVDADLATLALALDLASARGANQVKLLFVAQQFAAWAIYA